MRWSPAGRYPGLGLPICYRGRYPVDGDWNHEIDEDKLWSTVEGLHPISIVPRDSRVVEERPEMGRLLPMREVAMMMIMDTYTDSPNWHEIVFDITKTDLWKFAMLQSDTSSML
ncbi:hypothetical protein MRB53_040956 [Persea americana]|nr:hypothetical protein MRB53_040956 [Persea americana]